MSTLSIDWVVYRSGNTAALDYRPTSSLGSEGEVLVEEVANVCEDFYSISEPFPKDERGHFFWASQKKKSYWALMVVRQVTEDEAAGLRPTLEFVALLLTDAQYSAFGRNPVMLIDANLFAAAREASRTTPPYAPICITSRPSMTSLKPPNEAVRQMFEKGGEVIWSQETQQSLLGHVANDKVARSFATWWPATRPVPTGLFHVVLRPPAPEQLSVQEDLEQLIDTLTTFSDNLLQLPALQMSVRTGTIEAGLTRANSVARITLRLLIDGLSDSAKSQWGDSQQKVKQAADGVVAEFKYLKPDLRSLPADYQKECDAISDRFARFATRILQEAHPARDFGGMNQQQLAIVEKRLIPSEPVRPPLIVRPQNTKIVRPLPRNLTLRKLAFWVGCVLVFLLLFFTLKPFIDNFIHHGDLKNDGSKHGSGNRGNNVTELQIQLADTKDNLKKNQADLLRLQQRRDSLRLLLDPSQKGLPWREAYEAERMAHKQLVQSQSDLDQLRKQKQVAEIQRAKRAELDEKIRALQEQHGGSSSHAPTILTDTDFKHALLEATIQANVKRLNDALFYLDSAQTDIDLLNGQNGTGNKAWVAAMTDAKRRRDSYQNECHELNAKIDADKGKLASLQDQSRRNNEVNKIPPMSRGSGPSLAELEKQRDQLVPSPPLPEVLAAAEKEVRKRQGDYEDKKRKLDSLSDPQVADRIRQLHTIETEFAKVQHSQTSLQKDLDDINNLLKLAGATGR